MRVAVCDDDAYYVDLILKYSRDYLAKRGAVAVCKGYTSAAELINDKASLPYYDLFLLDIRMPNITGFDIAPYLRLVCPEAKLAFVTTFAVYARDGYKYGAMRYILKSDDILRTELEECLSTMLKTRRFADMTENIRIGNIRKRVRISDIVYYESRRNYVYVITKAGHEYIKEPSGVRLGQIEELMSDRDFVRIHQSFLVNMKYIVSVNYSKVKCVNDIILPVSHSFAKDAVRKVRDYKKEWLFTENLGKPL